MNQYLTVKLTLADSPGKPGSYTSRIESSDLGASSGAGFEFTLPPIPSGATSFAKFFEILAEQEAPDKKIIKKLGKDLFKCILNGTVKDKWNKILGLHNAGNNNKIRLALNILSPDLVKVPWELLHDDNSFVIGDTISIVRLIDELVAPEKSFAPIRNPLIIVANPDNIFDATSHIEQIIKEFTDAHIPAANIKILKKATENNIFDFLTNNPKSDFLYFLGHGGIDENGDGVIVLESDSSQQTVNLPSENLAKAIGRQRNIRLVYFNSCSTAEGGDETFSGVAQNVMLHGDVASVVAMQSPILATNGMKIARSFIKKIMRIETSEDALSLVRNEFVNDSFTWAIPVIYTHQRGPEDFEKNQLLSMLGSSRRDEKYCLCIPSFKNTLLMEEIMEHNYDVQISVKDKDMSEIFHYPGLTFAKSDVEATGYIAELLSKVASPDKIKLIAGNEIQNENESNCIFLFGSRSNAYVLQVQNGYKPIFQLYYTDKEWYMIDTVHKKKYSIKPPYNLLPGEWDKECDYCCIQKIITKEGQVYFLISGLGDRGTEGGSQWFSKNWKQLLSEWGTDSFQCLLRVPTSNPASAELIVDRKTNDWGKDYEGT